jgi:hypothetical protein
LWAHVVSTAYDLLRVAKLLQAEEETATRRRVARSVARRRRLGAARRNLAAET